MSVSVTFGPQPNGQSSPQCINVLITDDNTLEELEMFTVELQSTNPNVSPDPTTNRAMVVIMDDDSMSVFRF